jgi:hypothetical protein
MEALVREIRDNVQAYRDRITPTKRKRNIRDRKGRILQDYTILKIYRCYLKNGRKVTIENMNITNVALNQIIIKGVSIQEPIIESTALGGKKQSYCTEEEMINGYVAPSYDELSETEKQIYNEN